MFCYILSIFSLDKKTDFHIGTVLAATFPIPFELFTANKQMHCCSAFVCLLTHCKETVQFMDILFVPKCCLAIEYIQYKMASFPHENVQFVHVPECCLRGKV